MSNELVLALAERGIFTILLVAGPILLLALAVGLAVSVFQATTQIQEQTLAFIPKIIAVLVGIIFFGPWMLTQLVEFTTNLYQNINNYIGLMNFMLRIFRHITTICSSVNPFLTTYCSDIAGNYEIHSG